MEKAKLNFIRFEAADVLTSSIFRNEATDLFYFYGLGSDKMAPADRGGGNLQIHFNGEDVTDQYLNTLYDETQNYAIQYNMMGVMAITSNGVEGQSSASLEEKNIYDGAYTLSGRKFTYKQ